MGHCGERKNLTGRQVQVHKNGRTIRTGYVKEVAVSAGVLRIEACGTEPRALYEEAQGYTARPGSARAR